MTTEATNGGFLVRPPGQGHRIGLTPEETITVKAGDADGNHRLGVFELDVAYLGGPPAHVHCGHDEAFWVLDGEFTFRVGDDTVTAGPGTFILVPAAVPHAFCCVSAGSGRMLVMFSPGGTEVYFHELSVRLALLPPGPPDLAAVADLLERHGVVIVGLPLRSELAEAGGTRDPRN